MKFLEVIRIRFDGGLRSPNALVYSQTLSPVKHPHQRNCNRPLSRLAKSFSITSHCHWYSQYSAFHYRIPVFNVTIQGVTRLTPRKRTKHRPNGRKRTLFYTNYKYHVGQNCIMTCEGKEQKKSS